VLFYYEKIANFFENFGDNNFTCWRGGSGNAFIFAAGVRARI